MNLITELKVGEKIEVELTNFKNRNKHFIVSQILDIKDKKIYISNPIRKGTPYPLLEGQQIKIIFYREEKGIFSFVAEIKHKKQSRILIYAVEPITEPVKTQRRFFFRLDVILKVVIRNLDEDKKVECIAKDLSGGGMKVISKAGYTEGVLLECDIYLKDGEYVTTVGDVIRSIKNPITNEYELGIKFQDISESVRNNIISFIFEKQRILRKKGLI
ncbi:flagellar brake protein [Alkaliphilus peptidifermentans]|uniref:C-di-GMP-binding flagellar brake protein YcgR, contains PilZNR and PilZ domains n=1 Tax=Alkaliphilus peptidifermentans DSM 18978 TaxID=1120976 RepID=A0A1G5DFT8_9FIRM|nr:PilZ domain-containing protein [Alkaliphilus peptidifermentans]SCY13506.1 c-di-GMP-binding flagellar brake protein YcgR, contains PilZNR and PilZ domains [Alkaliphilus peptidifermentans DSM 18978]